jgi:hypothetical protein
MRQRFSMMTLDCFTNLLEHLPPDTRIAGPYDQSGSVSIWATSDDAGESAVYVVSGETVCRVSGGNIHQHENCYETLLQAIRGATQ